MFHLTPQGRALAGIGIVVSITTLVTLCCIVFYLCLTHSKTIGIRDGDAEYAKACEHWYKKQRRRKEPRNANKKQSRRMKQQNKAVKQVPNHHHNKCECKKTDKLELPRQCGHESPQALLKLNLEHIENKTYINLDCLKSPITKDTSHVYESIRDRNDTTHEVYFTAQNASYQSESTSDVEVLSFNSLKSINDCKNNIIFKIGSSVECVTMDPDYDNTSYLGPAEQTAIEPSTAPSSSSMQLFQSPINILPNSNDNLYNAI